MTLHAPQALEIIEEVTQRLTAQHARAVDETVVRALVLDSFRRYRHLDHPANHGRALAAQLAADRLEALRFRARHASRPAPPSFLFVCSGNAGRSQLAAALMRSIAPLSTRVVSAGEHPAARVLPAVTDTLDELGIPSFGEYPKPVTPEFVAAADHIVVLNCDDGLESLDGREFRTWSIMLESTSGRPGLRRTRDQIAEHVRALAREHGIEPRRP
jgi:ArsR family transcriptional regulator